MSNYNAQPGVDPELVTEAVLSTSNMKTHSGSIQVGPDRAVRFSDHDHMNRHHKNIFAGIVKYSLKGTTVNTRPLPSTL